VRSKEYPFCLHETQGILMGMDPRRLLIFRAVARSGSISAAARELGWTQPAVSQHLAALEREAGTPLLIRGSRGVSLTEAGRLLLARSDAVAGQLQLAQEELAAVTRLRRGRVRLAAYPSALATVVPPAVAALKDRHPDVDVTLVDAEPPEALDLLGGGDADLALVFGYDGSSDAAGSGLRWEKVASEPVHLVVAPSSPHARGPVTIADLAAEPWIVGCQRCRGHLLELCREAGFDPVERHSTDDYVVRQNLVAAGLGVTLLPEAALAAYRHPDVVVRRDPAFGRRAIGIAYRDGAQRVPAHAALLGELRTRLAATA
jgi:molybdate transport repressor ModE-like protein